MKVFPLNCTLELVKAGDLAVQLVNLVQSQASLPFLHTGLK